MPCFSTPRIKPVIMIYGMQKAKVNTNMNQLSSMSVVTPVSDDENMPWMIPLRANKSTIKATAKKVLKA